MLLATPQIHQTHSDNPILQRKTSLGAYPLSHSSDRQDARPIEVLVELASFDEFIILNVFLHLLSRAHKVVVLAVHLVLSPWTSCICRGQWNGWNGSLFLLLQLYLTYCLDLFVAVNSRGTQEPNLWGNSEMRSSFTLSFIGPNMITGLV